MLGVDDHYRHVGREKVRKHSGGLVFVDTLCFKDCLLGELLLARGTVYEVQFRNRAESKL